MNDKINVSKIIIDHFKTLSNTTGVRLVSDYICFVFAPIALSIVSILFQYRLSDNAISMLINFGSIITALLLSVLVLIFDQDRKLQEGKDNLYENKKNLFKQLYSNICYSVLAAIFLVALCLTDNILGGYTPHIKYFALNLSSNIFTPIIIAITINLMLTILMITKRIYIILNYSAEKNNK